MSRVSTVSSVGLPDAEKKEGSFVGNITEPNTVSKVDVTLTFGRSPGYRSRDW